MGSNLLNPKKKVITLNMLFKRILMLISFSGIGFILFWGITGKRLAAGLKPKANGTHDYAVILGAKVNGEVPSLSLRYRLEAALTYALEYTHVQLVLSGGQGPGEDISEAEAMKRYLTRNGIAEDRLILEDGSTSTYENLAFSLEKIEAKIKGITLITSDYHLTRATWLASTFDLEVDVVAAPTPKVVETKLRMRERLALLKTKVAGK